MKKYRNSSFILLITLLSLTVFYVNQAFSSSKLPDFYIKQTSGDAKILDTLELEAIYHNANVDEYLTVTKDQTRYLSESSYFKQIDYWDHSRETAEMNDLTEQFPTFMRGKWDNTKFYIDSKQLIYVEPVYDFSSLNEVRNYKLKVSQLNKKTEETLSFVVNIPHQENSGYIDVTDVQIIKGELRVIIMSEGDSAKLHEYTINIQEEKLINDTTIFTTESPTEEQYYYIYQLTDINPTQTNSNFIFLVEKNMYVSEEDSSQTVSSGLYSYNYNSGELAEINLPDDLTKKLLIDGNYVMAYDNQSLYASLLKDDNGSKTINMIKYDYKNQKMIKNHTIQLENEMADNWAINLYQNNLILTYSGKESKPYIKILNFDSGEAVFVAYIELRNKSLDVNYRNISINKVLGL